MVIIKTNNIVKRRNKMQKKIRQMRENTCQVTEMKPKTQKFLGEILVDLAIFICKKSFPYLIGGAIAYLSVIMMPSWNPVVLVYVLIALAGITAVYPALIEDYDD
ncbi:hypothetical protein K8R20_00305 [bacterium]|nr:hypothetical protein [bacterium]